MTADDREYEIEDDSPRLPSSAHRTRPVRIVTDEWVAKHDAELVESIAAGFDARALQARINGALDPPGRDIDAVLAWECAARWIREHTGNRFPSPQGATAGSGGTPGPPDPRDAVVDRAVEWRHRYSTPDIHLNVACMALADAVDALPATSPTGDPT